MDNKIFAIYNLQFLQSDTIVAIAEVEVFLSRWLPKKGAVHNHLRFLYVDEIYLAYR